MGKYLLSDITLVAPYPADFSKNPERSTSNQFYGAIKGNTKPTYQVTVIVGSFRRVIDKGGSWGEVWASRWNRAKSGISDALHTTCSVQLAGRYYTGARFMKFVCDICTVIVYVKIFVCHSWFSKYVSFHMLYDWNKGGTRERKTAQEMVCAGQLLHQLVSEKFSTIFQLEYGTGGGGGGGCLATNYTGMYSIIGLRTACNPQ